MGLRGWCEKALLSATAVALLASFAPTAAFARGVTVKDIKRGGKAAIKALQVQAQDSDYTIDGTLHYETGDWAGSSISAVAFSNVGGVWTPAFGGVVNSDGTYSIEATVPGTYRVGFFDANRVYADDYYQSVATSVGAAGVQSLNVTGHTEGIDDTVTAVPELSIGGTVHLTGAPVVEGDVSVEVYSLDSDTGEWVVAYTAPVAANGTYKVHVDTAGTYRVGFFDGGDAFTGTFYGGSTIDSATDILVTAGDAQLGVDGTMTAQPSIRYGGTDALDTAVQLSQSAFEDGFGGTVVICTGDTWADSLAAGSYAYAVNAPMLLVHKKTVPSNVIDELERLDPTEVVIVGGTAAVSLDDEMAIRATGASLVRRLQGVDRYGTSVAVAQEMVNRGLVLSDENGGLLNCAFATGATQWDAMVGAPAAADGQMPLLLVTKNAVPPAVASFLASNEGTNTGALVFGSSSSIATATASLLASAPYATADNPAPSPWDNITRLGGKDRYSTSVLVADYLNNFSFSPRKVALCTDKSYVDAIAAGPILAARKEALLVTAPKLISKKVVGSPKPYGYTQLSPSVEVYISKQTTPVIDPTHAGPTDTSIARIDAIGNTTALPDDVWNYALTKAQIAH